MRRLTVVFLLALSCVSCSNARVRSQSAPTHASTSAPRTTPSALIARVAAWKLPQAISRAIALEVRNNVFILGGLAVSGVSTQNVTRVAVGSWDVLPDGLLVRASHDAAGAVLSGKVFVFGGGETATVDTVQGVSQKGSRVTSRVVGRLPQPRSDLCAATIGGAAYIVGGYDGSRLLSNVLRTTDGARFATVATLPHAARYCAAVAVGNIIYVFGGSTGSADVNTIQAIDTATGRAQVVARLPHPLAHASAVLFKDSVYVLGGRNDATTSNEVLRFDPASKKVSLVGRLPYAESDAAVITLADRVLLIGGETGPQRRQTANVIEVV